MELYKTEKGSCAIKLQAIEDICNIACQNVKDVYPVKDNNFYVSVTLADNLISSIKLTIKVKQGCDIVKTCNNIQNEIHDNLLLMTNLDCKKINIDINGFIK